MQLKFKKLSEDAVLPSYAKPGDAGLDLTATSNGNVVTNKENEDISYYIEYETSLAVEIPQGYVGLLFPRSSISNTALSLANSIGVVDSGYRGPVCLRFKMDAGTVYEANNQKKQPSKYKKGDRIGQLVILPYPTIEPEFTDVLSETERGAGGFGSTTENVKGV